MVWSTTYELYNSRDKGQEEGSQELLLQFHPKAFALHPTTRHLCSSFFLHIVFFFTQIMDNYDHSWDMSVYHYVFHKLRLHYGLQIRVVVLAVHSSFYSRWYIASVVVHQVLGHRNYRLAEDHLGPYVFVAVYSNIDLQTLLSYNYEFCGAEVFSHPICYLIIYPNDLEIGGVCAVPFN
jgi:hypothetical protein